MKRGTKLLSCIVVLAMVIAIMPMSIMAAGVATNLVSNGDFESGNTTGWTVASGATAVVGAGYAYNSNYGVLVTPSAGSNASEPSLAYNFPVEANKRYVMTAMIRPTTAWKMMIPVASGCGLPKVSTPLLTTKKVDWFKIVNTIAPEESGTATFYIQRNWNPAEANNLLPSYYLDDVCIYELKLKESEDLNPDKGVLSVNLPSDIGLTADMVSLSSGSVTGVSYTDGNWNIAYANLTPSTGGTVNFAIPINADSSYNNTPAAANTTIYQSLNFTTGKPSVPSIKGNLVSNSGFESGNTNGWTVAQGATAVVGKAYAYTGDNGVLVTPSAGSAASEPSFAYSFPVEANKKYFMSAMIRPTEAWKMMIPVASGCGLPSVSSPLLTSKKVDWFKIVNTIAPTETGNATFYIQRNWNVNETNNLLSSYYLDDVVIYELKLKEASNLVPDEGVISVNFPSDIGLTADMITLSSGNVTDVLYGEGNWNISYENLAANTAGTITFNIPVHRNSDYNNTIGENVTTLSQTFNFTTTKSEKQPMHSYSSEARQDVEITTTEFNFNNDAINSVPAGITPSPAGVATTIARTNGASGDNALRITSSADVPVYAHFSLPKAITSGITDFSFDYYTPSNAPSNFYLSGSAYGACISLSGSGIGVVNPNAQTVPAVTGMQPNQRHTVVAHIDMDKHVITLTVDGNDVKENGNFKEFPFRNNIASITGGFFGIGKSSGKTVEIDNFKVQTVYKGQTFINEGFDKEITNSAPSAFVNSNTGTSSGSAPKVVVKADDGLASNGAETGKAMELISPTESGKFSRAFYELPYELEGGLVDFSFDWYAANRTGAGEVHLCDNGVAIATLLVGGGSVQYQTPARVETLATVTEGQWHKAVVHMNIGKGIYTIEIDGTDYATEIPFRNSGIFGEVHIRLHQSNASGKTMQFDNIKIERKFRTQKSAYESFENGLGILTGDGGVLANRVEDGIPADVFEAGKAVQMKINASADTQMDFNLPETLGSGIVDVSFDLYKSEGAPRIQFYLTNSAGGFNPLTVQIAGSDITGHYSGTYSTAFTEGKWHNVMFHMNFATKTVSGTLDGIPMTNNGETEWTFRSDGLSDETVCDIAKGFFKVDKSSNTSSIIQIDNFRVEKNITGDQKMTVVFPEGMTESSTNNYVYGAPFGETVRNFISDISVTPSNCEIYIINRNGVRKNENDTIAKYDRIIVTLTEAGVSKEYELRPTYSIDFRGIEINGNEYFEASKIIEPGMATVRARLTNLSTAPISVNVYGAVTGGKLYDIESKFNQEIAAGGYKDYKFELNIPDKTDDLSLKLMVMDEEFTPVTEYEHKLIFTSQEISMPNIFSDHMVLQRGEPVNIYGFAPTGTNIEVNFGEYSAEGVAEGGKFFVQLPAMEATNVGKDLVVTAGDETFTYENVVVGEVLFGSGQSNMEQALSWETSGRNLGQLTNLRYFSVAKVYSTAGRVDGGVAEGWTPVNSSNWTSVSALMHCTVYHLRDLGIIDESIPVGIINCSWGGTGIGMWMSADALESAPVDSVQKYYERYLNSVADSKGIRQTDLFSAMAKSVTPYTVKSAVWYQGENDANVLLYNEYMDRMVADMRAEFGKDVPYFSIQLPGFNLDNWKQFRLTQWKSHDPENGINVIVTNDTGDVSDIHPHDKAILGERIARQMAKNVYGIDMPYTGPVYKSASVSGNAVTVSFDFVNDGIHGGLCSIASDGASLPNFELSADGKAWYAATASISGDTVVLSSANVSAPAYVRFGYVAGPVKSLGTSTNGVKLPLAPFSEAIN